MHHNNTRSQSTSTVKKFTSFESLPIHDNTIMKQEKEVKPTAKEVIKPPLQKGFYCVPKSEFDKLIISELNEKGIDKSRKAIIRNASFTPEPAVFSDEENEEEPGQPISNDSPFGGNQVVKELDSDDDESTNSPSEEAARLADDTPDPLLQPIDIIDPSIGLCPFCPNPLPEDFSPRGESSLNYLLALPEIEANPTKANPGGMRLAFAATAAFCTSHFDESVTIPDGIKAGYPDVINFAKLPRRIEGIRLQLENVILDTVTSELLAPALEAYKTSKRGGLAEMASSSVEQPGYFGPLGYEVIYNTLKLMFLDKTDPFLTLEHTKGLPFEFYLRRVLVPETSIFLIAEDLKICKIEAADARIESSAFWNAVHSNTQSDLEEMDESASFEKDLENVRTKKGKDKEIVEAGGRNRKRDEESGQVELEPTSATLRRSSRISAKKDESSSIILSCLPVTGRRTRKVRNLQESYKRD